MVVFIVILSTHSNKLFSAIRAISMIIHPSLFKSTIKHPFEVVFRSPQYRYSNHLWHFIAVQLLYFGFDSFHQTCPALDDDQDFWIDVGFSLPGIDRLNSFNKIGAGGQFVLDQGSSNFGCFFFVGSSDVKDGKRGLLHSRTISV